MPAGMLFVPSIGGISHHWSENTDDADIVTGAQVFVETCRRLLAGNPPRAQVKSVPDVATLILATLTGAVGCRRIHRSCRIVI